MHHWGKRLTALGFGLDWVVILVSMLTDSFHRLILGKSCDHSSSFILIGSSLLLHVTRTTIKDLMGSKFDRMRQRTYELAALVLLKKSP